MPTATKLIAGLYFAAVGYLLATWLPEIDDIIFAWPMLWVPVAVMGLLLGWRFVGARAEAGVRAALSSSFTATISLLIIAVVMSAFATMIGRALGRRYRGLAVGLEDMMAIMADGFIAVARADVAVVIIVGALIGGLFAGLVARISR